MKIESHDRTIGDLLNSGYYVIPRFQRPYSWDIENIVDFWNDAVLNEDRDYFIGSMVVYTAGERKFGVVDGQQRLTTIMILLSVVRDALDATGHEKQASGLHRLIERENIDFQSEFVLQTESSFPYFQAKILSRGASNITVEAHREEGQLQIAHNLFSDLIDTVVTGIQRDRSLTKRQQQEVVKKRLTEIRDAILSLKLIFITLDSEDDAYVIFETLNTRGKDLALADLVKNHFTKLLRPKNKQFDQTKIKWAKILETIEGAKFDLTTDTFIYHYWLSKREYIAASKIFKEFRRIVTVKNANDVLNDMEADSQIYRALHEPDFFGWEKSAQEAKASLVALNTFRVRQQVPCTLSLMRAYVEKKMKISQLQLALSHVEKFHFLFTAITSQRSSGGISGMYAALARQIASAKDAQALTPIINELRTKLKERLPSEAEFVALFPELIYTNLTSKQRGLTKYVLSKIVRKKGHAFKADLEDLTIEHLYPQSGINESDWPESIVGQIGNLILVPKSINQKLENKSYSEKIRILRSEKCEDLLPDYFLQAKELAPDLILRRTKELAEFSYREIWNI